MKKIIYHVIGLGLISLSLVSCDRFLSQAPDDRTQINDVPAAKELAVTAYPEYHYAPLFELRCDNVADLSSRLSPFNSFDENMYLYEETVKSTYQDSPQGYWRSCYEAVAAANQVLYDLDRVGAKGEQADATRGEALVARAYAMYMLAQTFTIPYDPTTAGKDLGLPYPLVPENKLIQEYERGTLQELYDKIAKDFEEGSKLIRDDYSVVKYHFNRQATAAFGTRLYRTLQKWDKVIELGNEAMGNDPSLYVRTINDPNSFYMGTTSEMAQIWGMETEPANFLVSVLVSSWCRNYQGRWRYGASWPAEGRPGLARTIFWGPNFLNTPEPGKVNKVQAAYPFYGSAYNAFAPKIEEHFEMTDKTTQTGFIHTQAILFSGDEVLFNMAEAYTMKNDFAKVEQLLQIFVSHFMKGYDESDPLYKVTKEKIVNFYQDKVGKILPDPVYGIEINTFNPSFETTPEQEMYLRACVDMKRIATIHDGMRWMDNRHFRMDIVHNVLSQGNAKQEYIVLRGTDPRYAYQLPSNVLPYLEKNPGYEKDLERISK